MKKIIVAHPSKQHSFQTAIALKKSGSLYKYITSVYDKKGCLTFYLKMFLNRKNRNKASTRRTEELEDSDVMCLYELSALLLLLVRRLPYFKRFYNDIFVWRRKLFGRKVAEIAMKAKVDAVIMYDSTALECFSILKEKAPQIKRILDVSIVNRAFMKMNFESDMKRTNSNELQIEEPALWDKKLMNDYIQEVLLSDYYFAPSNIVKKSLVYVGADAQNIFVIPYGVNAEKFGFIKKGTMKSPAKLLFVGQVGYRKGIHHLLKVLSSFSKGSIELYLAGGYNTNSLLYQKYKEDKNIHFLGFVTRDILAELYQKCDIFVFPTLGEGYGMVVLEALSCGVPCIVSDLAGGDDAIVDGYNGLKFQAGNDEELYDKINWFITHPEMLPELSENSRQTIKNLTWNDYHIKIKNAIEHIK